MRFTALQGQLHKAALCLLVLFGAGALAPLYGQNYRLSLSQPTMDSWFYPFATNPGGRLIASTFGAFGSDDFDNRDGQFYMGFVTSGTVPAGLSPSSYQVVSVNLTLSINTGGGKVYDSTYDPVNTYAADGSQINDDAGRPMELFGAGYRNGVTSVSVNENTPFSTVGQPVNRTRSVYATDFLAAGSLNGGSRDVSNSVADRFNTVPFAIGSVTASDLADGKIVEDGDVLYSLNLNIADVLRYLQLSLAEGRLGLIATSLDLASQFGDVTYPDYYTRENTLGDSARLELVVNVIPEPDPVALFLACGILYLATRRLPAARRFL